MRLFDHEDAPRVQISTEAFHQYHRTAEVVSMEAISDYLYKLKDGFVTLKAILVSDQDKVLTQALTTRFETQHVVKRLKFIDIKDHTVQIPENFKGKYIDYAQDLLQAATTLVPNTLTTLNNLKLAVASFINEYTEDKMHSLYGVAYFKEAEKLTEEIRKDIAKYFPKQTNATKAPIGSVLKTLSDITPLYETVQKLEAVINLDTIEQVNRLALDCSDLVDVLIEQNTKSGVLLKNNATKKELVDIIHITARQVELVSYLYGNAVFFYSSFKRLSELLVELGDTEVA